MIVLAANNRYPNLKHHILNPPKNNYGATGRKFSGQSVRTFTGSKKVITTDYTAEDETDVTCDKWGVLTTINPSTEAVRRQVQLSGWCLVIVADQKSPKGPYETGWTKGRGNKHVVYLSVADQENMKNDFIHGIPWNHFGRKSIGYLYAKQHGAKVIWDFDDDNIVLDRRSCSSRSSEYYRNRDNLWHGRR